MEFTSVWTGGGDPYNIVCHQSGACGLLNPCPSPQHCWNSIMAWVCHPNQWVANPHTSLSLSILICEPRTLHFLKHDFIIILFIWFV